MLCVAFWVWQRLYFACSQLIILQLLVLIILDLTKHHFSMYFFFGFLALTRYLFPSFYNQFLSICYFTFLLSTLAFYAFREVKNFQLAHWLCNYCCNCTNWINNFLLYQTFKIWTQIIHAKKIACWNYLICRSIWTFVIGNN